MQMIVESPKFSVCGTPEINMILYVNYTSIKKSKKYI